MIVARPLNDNEKDLLAGNEHLDLIITDLNGCHVCSIPAPAGNWTHDKLEDAVIEISSSTKQGWAAYLGDHTNWIGSSEI